MLVRLALEPQCEARFADENYGFRIGRNHHDAVESIFSYINKSANHTLSINLLKSLYELKPKDVISQLQCSVLLSEQINSWLFSGLLEEYLYQSHTFENYIFETPKGSILAPLIVNLFLSTLFVHLEAEYSIHQYYRKIKYMRYAHHVLILFTKQISAFQFIKKIKLCLKNFDITLEDGCWDIKFITSNLNFLNYKINFQHNYASSNIRFVEIFPSKQSIFLFVQGNREIIQRLKSSSINLLVKRLRDRTLEWGIFYSDYVSQELSSIMDNILLAQIRAILLRKHPKKSKHWVKKKYFPNNSNYYFFNVCYRSSWTLIDPTSIQGEFVPKIRWIRLSHYTAVLIYKSPYDGDKNYWLRRKRGLYRAK
nr:hypothetical protein [Porphyropsis coccinea]